VIFGVSSPITWGIAMFFLALIPYVGTGLVWGPAAAIMILQGASTSDNYLLWKGIGLAIYGLIIVSSIDNILKPKIIGHHSRVHPVLVLVGIFGGLALMGIPGIVVGPVALAMAVTLLELYVSKKTISNT
jgi:predicted PurR-regulated permease PerM